MKNLIISIVLLQPILAIAQLDKEQMALAISKVDEANTEKLREYIWKRKSDVSVDGAVKLTTVTEFSFDESGKLQAKLVDAESSVKQKPGLRGRAQQNAAEDKMDYVSKALDLSLAYTFMTKGQLLDFFGKAVVTEKDDTIEAFGENIYVQGDKLKVIIDKKTNLYTKKEFSSLLGKDAVEGEVNYNKFSSGVNHGSTTILKLPTQNMQISAENTDYSKRVN
ncbi:MAG: hypothetical protein RIB47_13850 [Cyclobacteriaceae bacterium]